MRHFLFLILSCISIYSIGQKKHFLNRAEFAQATLNESWIIVKIIPGTQLSLDEGTEVKILHHKSSEKSILDGMCKIKLKSDQNPIDFCNQLLKQDNVIYAEPIIQEQPLYAPSDPNSSNQSYLSVIKAYEAWGITRGDDDITIAIIDTGIDLDHEDLASNLWTNDADPIDGIDNDENGYIDDLMGYDFADDDNDPNADNSAHGAGVAGVAGAATDNNIGISGIGFNTKIAALKGFRTSTNTSSGLYDAIIYAVDNGIEVLNLSWGSVRLPLQSEQDIINYAVLENNVVVIAAAGNDGNKESPEAKFYPASYDNVLSVGATDIDDNRWVLSTYNYSVDLMAPGNFIHSTLSDDAYGSNFGTSFSAPMVSGVAALVLDVFPDLTAQQIMERIRVTSDDIYDIGSNVVYDGKLGKGRLNAFRAVTDGGLKSLRAENINLSATFEDQFFFGDTVQVTGAFVNYLSKLNDPVITFSSENQLSFPNNLAPGSMLSLSEKEFSFQFIIPETTEPGTDLAIRMDIADGSYNDFQFIELSTAPDYVDFGNEKVFMTIAGGGNLGYADSTFSDGIGFQSELGPSMQFTGVYIATSASSLSDNTINNYTSGSKSQDFTNSKNYKRYTHPSADFFGYSEFLDSAKNIVVEQSNLAWENEDFMILRYRIINNSADTLEETHIGTYMDWDIDNSSQNRTAYNAESQFIFSSNEAENQFAASKIISDGTVHYSLLDIDSFNGNDADVQGDFSDALKYNFLTINQYDSAGIEGAGNNIASLHGATISEILPYQSEYVYIILAVNSTLKEIENTLASAEERLIEFETNPRVLETFKICNINQVSISPSTGSEFEFFSDPKGINTLAIGSTFEPEGISSDTTFYVRNIDGLYKSDIFQIRLQLFNEISSFVQSTDTLYLDNATTNVVSFTDTSLDAISWEWDFGQGTTSNIQNPSISFNQEGSYTITLIVTNDIGCVDSSTRNLVVTERPSAPILQDFTICPNDSINLDDPTADRLIIYSSPNSDPIVSGNLIDVGPFIYDSTIYVSGIYNGFESEKTAVSITVYDVLASFEVLPDTLNSEFNMQLNAMVEDESSFQWFIDDIASGSESTISVAANQVSVNIKLEVVSEESCVLIVEENIQTSTSPIPSQNDVSICAGESVLIRPTNGTYFGFYRDEGLTELIKKGTQLEWSESGKLYIVGLDDGLPSQAIEVNIDAIPFSVEIDYTVETVADKNKITFSVNTENEVNEYEWYVNGILLETSSSPTLFLNNESYVVVLHAMNDAGCSANDTLSIDFTPPIILGADTETELVVYPNPSPDGLIFIQSIDHIKSIEILNISGKSVHFIDRPSETINLDFLASGIYFIKAFFDDKISTTMIILRK